MTKDLQILDDVWINQCDGSHYSPEEGGTGGIEHAVEGTPNVEGLVVHHLAACKDQRHNEAAREEEEAAAAADSRDSLDEGQDMAGSLKTDHRLVRRIH